MEVRSELNRTQRKCLRFCLEDGGGPLKIMRLEDIPNPEEGFRVAAPELEPYIEGLDTLLGRGEEKLKDLSNALCKGQELEIPEVEELDQTYYERMYKEQPEETEATGPRIVCPSQLLLNLDGQSGTEDGDYDLDDEDKKFLKTMRKSNPDFKVTDSLFEKAVEWLLKCKCRRESILMKKFSSKKPRKLACLSAVEMRLIVHYFGSKSDSSSVPWQPKIAPAEGHGLYTAFNEIPKKKEPANVHRQNYNELIETYNTAQLMRLELLDYQNQSKDLMEKRIEERKRVEQGFKDFEQKQPQHKPDPPQLTQLRLDLRELRPILNWRKAQAEPDAAKNCSFEE